MAPSHSRRRPVRLALAAVLALTSLLAVGLAPVRSHSLVPQIGQALVPPVGFGQSLYAELPPGDLATSLTFGPDGRLYVTAVQGVAAGDGFSALSAGRVYAISTVAGVLGGAPTVVASGFDQALGIVFGPDKTMYVADNANNAGRIQALRDTNGDGAYEQPRTVLKNVPNGRHQLNGMTFGPDGMLYAANGNATDDGIDCGPEPASPAACPTSEMKPWTGAILRVDPAWNGVDLQKDVTVDTNGVDDPGILDDEQVLAAQGFRNIYDVDFQPGKPCTLFTPMNGSDSPASNEPLYRTDVCDTQATTDAAGAPAVGPRIDDAGFPSCLYGAHDNPFPTPNVGGHAHPGTLEPEDNLNPAVMAKFGPCQKDTVLKPILFFDSAHNGVSGLAFERGNNFPDRYDGALFVAEWGSMWNLNGAEASGHKITQVDLDKKSGQVTRRRTFMSGGAPMDLTFGPDGAMYVADFHGSIYRVASVQETPDSVTVEIRNGQFVPQVVAITQDMRVNWANLDTVPHNVTAVRAVIPGDPSEEPVLQPGDEINSTGDIAPRASHSHQFGAETGVWVYHSTTTSTDDATMQGAVVVTPLER